MPMHYRVMFEHTWRPRQLTCHAGRGNSNERVTTSRMTARSPLRDATEGFVIYYSNAVIAENSRSR